MRAVQHHIRATLALCGIVLALLSSACNTTPPAPVVERNATTSTYRATRDGYYRVRRGDSLHAIAFKYGLDWREIAGWNRIASPYTIYPDQQLRISPPKSVTSNSTAASGSQQASRPTATGSRVETSGKPPPGLAKSEDVPVRSSATTKPAVTSVETKSAPSKPAVSASATPKASTVVSSTDPNQWVWPTKGRVISTFRADDPARKGVEISGTKGQPVNSSAAGQVVYSGNGLIGYGELIIIKHSERMLSAYAHNSKRLVSEGDMVSAGQHIAAMGTDERKDPLLHFEIRVNGKPTDPLKYLIRR